MPDKSSPVLPQTDRSNLGKLTANQALSRFQLAVVVLSGLILICMIIIMYTKFSEEKTFLFGLLAEVVVGLVSNLFFTVLLAILIWFIVHFIHKRDQNDIGSIFGIDELNPEMTVFLSNMYIEPNGTRALEEVDGGYVGSAVCRVEYQAGIRVRELVEKISVLNMPKQLYDYLGRTALGFQQLKVVIHLSRLPSKKHRRSRPRAVSHTVVAGQSTRIAPITDDGVGRANAGTTTSITGVQIESEKGIVAQTLLSGATEAIVNPDGSSDVLTTSIEGTYYCWESYRQEKFWIREIGPCRSVMSIGSNIYNSVTRYYTDSYFEAYKMQYDCFPTFMTTKSEPYRGIRLWRNPASNRDHERYLRAPDSMMEPAFIARFVDLGIVDGQTTDDRDVRQPVRTVFLCAGISHVATAASVKYLIHNWKRIRDDYGPEDFFIPLWVDSSGKEPDHFDKIKMPGASADRIFLRNPATTRR